jgi:hypothetical protein
MEDSEVEWKTRPMLGAQRIYLQYSRPYHLLVVYGHWALQCRPDSPQKVQILVVRVNDRQFFLVNGRTCTFSKV